MRRQLYPAVMTMVVFTILLGVVYPLVVTGMAQGVFPAKANGSKIESRGAVVGSKLLGQTFTDARYFHGRPTAAGAAASGSAVSEGAGSPAAANDPKDLSQDISSGSNLGPTSQEFLRTIAERARAYRIENGLANDADVPVDAVTASASGLDPHISIANARIQARRVALVRHLPLHTVLRLVEEHTDGRSLGFLGEKGVNVLEVNLALDRLTRP